MGSFPCEKCDKKYNRPSLLAQHMRTHTGERPFKCDECESAFTRKAHLDSHRRCHSKERALTCPECGKGVHTKQHLERHMNFHRKDHVCPQCNAAFRMQIQLDRHILRHSLACVCGQTFRTPSLLARHRRTDKTYKCTKCDHIAECPMMLSNHFKEHKEEAALTKKTPTPEPVALPLPPAAPAAAITTDIDPDLLLPPSKRKRPRETGKTTIGLLTGSIYNKRPIPCPVKDCLHRANRDYDLARHIATVHPERVLHDLRDDMKQEDDQVSTAAAAVAASASMNEEVPEGILQDVDEEDGQEDAKRLRVGMDYSMDIKEQSKNVV